MEQQGTSLIAKGRAGIKDVKGEYRFALNTFKDFLPSCIFSFKLQR